MRSEFLVYTYVNNGGGLYKRLNARWFEHNIQQSLSLGRDDFQHLYEPSWTVDSSSSFFDILADIPSVVEQRLASLRFKKDWKNGSDNVVITPPMLISDALGFLRQVDTTSARFTCEISYAFHTLLWYLLELCRQALFEVRAYAEGNKEKDTNAASVEVNMAVAVSLILHRLINSTSIEYYIGHLVQVHEHRADLPDLYAALHPHYALVGCARWLSWFRAQVSIVEAFNIVERHMVVSFLPISVSVLSVEHLADSVMDKGSSDSCPTEDWETTFLQSLNEGGTDSTPLPTAPSILPAADSDPRDSSETEPVDAKSLLMRFKQALQEYLPNPSIDTRLEACRERENRSRSSARSRARPPAQPPAQLSDESRVTRNRSRVVTIANLMSEHGPYNGNMHCETILASLTMYDGRELDVTTRLGLQDLLHYFKASTFPLSYLLLTNQILHSISIRRPSVSLASAVRFVQPLCNSLQITASTL